MTPVSNECATEGCANAGTERFEAGGVGSQYCTDCRAKITALHSYDKQALEGAAEFFEQIATMGNPAPLAFAQAIRRALRSKSPEPSSSVRVSALAIEALKHHQRQLDEDGVEVGVSRQALDELLAAYDALEAPTVSPAMEQGEVEVVAWRSDKGGVSLSSHPFLGAYALVRLSDYQALKAELEGAYAYASESATAKLEKANNDLIARLATAEGALKPFADEAKRLERIVPSAAADEIVSGMGNVTVGDFRRAREALTTITGGENER